MALGYETAAMVVVSDCLALSAGWLLGEQGARMGTFLNNFLELAAFGTFLIAPRVEATPQGDRAHAANLDPITHD